MRMWEGQAAFDLYLLRLRQIEDEHDPQAKAEDGHHYPELVLETTPTTILQGSTLERKENTFIVTTSQLHQHLARRGSLTDRLDSPLLFARSGVLMFDYHRHSQADDIRDAPYAMEREHGQLFSRYEPHDFADIFSWREGLSNARRHHSIPPFPEAFAVEPSFSNAPTIGSILALGRSILSYTSSLESLSLTGFLERLVCGNRSPAALKALQAVTIGPPPPYWYAPLHFENEVFATVEKLRMCGTALTGWQLDAIKGERNQLPALTELQYSSVDTTAGMP